jgi:hypothetical protein
MLEQILHTASMVLPPMLEVEAVYSPEQTVSGRLTKPIFIRDIFSHYTSNT